MALALLNEFIQINSVDISAHCRQGTLAFESTDLDSTTFGDTWNEHTGGLKSGTLTIEALDDFAASQLDDTLWPLLGTVVTFEVRPTADPVATDNPSYTGSVFIQQHSLGGSLNELATKSLTFPTSGTVSRATS